MENTKKGFTFSKLLETIHELPLWVIQGLYVEVNSILKEKGNTLNLETLERTEMFQLYKPKPSSLGKMLLAKPDSSPEVPHEVILFLESSQENRNIVDIATLNQWSLEECAKILWTCFNNSYLEPNYSPVIHTTIQFIAGYIKIGEFLVRKNKITESQLQKGLQVQKDINQSFEDKVKIVEVLINLGYVQKDDVSEFIKLKEVAKDHTEISDSSSELFEKIDKLEKEIKKSNQDLAVLTADNNFLVSQKTSMEKELSELKDKYKEINAKNIELQNIITEQENKFGIFKKL